MEKRISFNEFQSVKSMAKAIDPIVRQKSKVQARIDSLDAEFEKKVEKLREAQELKKQKIEAEMKGYDAQIAAMESGIVHIIGFHVADLIKKVVETDASGNKTTKYLPTDMVSYDPIKKQYVITFNPAEDKQEEEEIPVVEEDEVEELPEEEELEEEEEEEAEELAEDDFLGAVEAVEEEIEDDKDDMWA